jgi:predicted Zn-dependent peptidase
MLTYYEVLLGDYRYISEYPKNIDQVTAEDIIKVAEVYLTKANRTIAVLEKKKD